MGGKRSDQHQLDPATTDRKFRPEDEGILGREKAELTEKESELEENMIPKGGKNPALADLQAKRAAKTEKSAAGKSKE